MTLGEIGSVASIISLLIAAVGGAIWAFRRYRRKREDAERELERQIERMRAAGGSVSARTDLGFFVLLEVESLRSEIATAYFFGTLYAVATMVGVAVGIAVAGTAPQLSYVIHFTVIVTFFGGCSIIVTALRLHYYASSYRSRVKGIWGQPIEKRAGSGLDGK